MSNSSIPSQSLDKFTVPAHLISDMVKVMEERGFDAQELLKGSGLKRCELQQGDAQIRYEQALIIIDNALVLYPDEGLGLVIGCREKVTSWGLLGFAIMSCATLREGMDMIQKFYPVSPALLDMRVNTQGGQCHMHLFPPYPIGHRLPFAVEEFCAAAITVYRELLEDSFRLTEVRVTYERPTYYDQYDKLFQCPIVYSSSKNVLIFDEQYLDKPLGFANDLSARLVAQLCEESLRKQEVVDSLENMIRGILLRNQERFPSQEGVAEQLGIHIRTLRRNLAAAGTSFQTIMDDVRKSLSQDYIRSTTLSLEEISQRVGFNDYGGFRRAFKRWTGHSPSYYRQIENARNSSK